MCVVSMVMDHYGDRWGKYVPPIWPPIWTVPLPSAPVISPEEVEEFRKLLERAREYDKQHNEPNCELESKKDRIKKLADELGVKVDFL